MFSVSSNCKNVQLGGKIHGNVLFNYFAVRRTIVRLRVKDS